VGGVWVDGCMPQEEEYIYDKFTWTTTTTTKKEKERERDCERKVRDDVF
jgi:hypothetical protein